MTESYTVAELLRAASGRAGRDNCASIQLLCRAVTLLVEQVAAIAPESAPPVPVTVPDAPPAAAGMTAEAFYAELDAIEAGAKRNGPHIRTNSVDWAVTAAVDLGARWRAATGLPLTTRPKGRSR